jgi:hypothetical protein
MHNSRRVERCYDLKNMSVWGWRKNGEKDVLKLILKKYCTDRKSSAEEKRDTGCGRNSELIVSKNNILLKATGTNFSTSHFPYGA